MISRSTDVQAALRDRRHGRRLQRGFFTLPGGMGAAKPAGGGGGGGGDPDFANVALLTHFDGSFADSSSYAHAPSISGSGLTTASGISKFGSGSLSGFSGANALRYASHPSFAAPGDFTLECWIYLTSDPTGVNCTIFNVGTFITGLFLRMNLPTVFELYINNSNVSFVGSALSLTTFYFLQLVRTSGSVFLYIDGSQFGVGHALAGSIAADIVQIGQSAHNAGEFFTGNIDDLRYTPGVARANAVPTAAFPDS